MHNNLQKLIEEIIYKIGRNILLFQHIERGLKIILPYIHPKAHSKGIDSFHTYSKGIKSQTLGHLINSFLESAKIDPEYFVEELKKIIVSRNNLVHGLDEFGNLNLLETPEGCQQYIYQLDCQHQEAVWLYKEIKLYLIPITYLLRKQYGCSNSDLKLLYKRLKSTIPSDTEYINADDPSDTIWKSTKIVKLLYLAEHNTKKIGDMTSLSLAGAFIKKIEPNCTSKKYGIQTLKGVLEVSGLFEIIEDENNNSLILYKSKSKY